MNLRNICINIISIGCILIAWSLLGLFMPDLGVRGQWSASERDRVKALNWERHVNGVKSLNPQGGQSFSEEALQRDNPDIYWPSERPGPYLKSVTTSYLCILFVIIVWTANGLRMLIPKVSQEKDDNSSKQKLPND